MKGESMHFAAFRIILITLIGAPSAASADPPPESQQDVIQLEEVVVTATRLPAPRSQVAASFTVIEAEEIARSGAADLGELLRAVPALDVTRSGGRGGVCTVAIRGAASEQTLVLLDGVELNDPLAPGRGFDFSTLDLEGVRRIEIVRGPQSSLYGADAIGGVVHGITEAAGEPGLELSAEAGSRESWRGGARWNSRLGPLRLMLSAGAAGGAGISAAGSAHGNSEPDGYQAREAALKLVASPAPWTGLELALRYSSGREELDNFGGALGDDPNHRGERERLAGRLEARLDPFAGRWEQRLALSLADQRREYRNPVDAEHPLEFSASRFAARSIKAEWLQTWRPAPWQSLLAGVEWEEQRGDSRSSGLTAWGPYESVFGERRMRTRSLFAQEQLLAGPIFATAGLRRDLHGQAPAALTWRLTGGLDLGGGGALLKCSYGTGYKAPSLYQLYSDYGNLDLRSERSRGWDCGLDLRTEAVSWTAAYFHNRFEDLIDYDPGSFRYANTRSAWSRGVEIGMAAVLGSRLSLRGGFTAQETEDRESGLPLLRRPVLKTEAGLDWRARRDLRLRLDWRYLGPREDLDFGAWPARRIELGGAALLDASAELRLAESLRLSLRADNLLDRPYEEILGYGAPGRRFTLGLRYRL